KKNIKGDIIITPTKDNFEIYEESYLVAKEGKILGIYKELGEENKDCHVNDFTGKMIIPGFVDIHLHAPQFPNRGLGLDKELIPWLNTYTFPEESKYDDLDYAKKIYESLVKELWRCGTTSSVVFSSIHKESTKILADLFIESDLRAYIGKVNMDRNAIPELTEDTEESLKNTKDFILEHKDKSYKVQPIITQRFVPTCTEDLMKGLGELAVKYDLPVQSHLSENRSEVEWVSELHPDIRDYASVYNEYNLLGQTKTIMAHCVYNTEEELQLMKE